ncbi:hypothetical protein DPMN_159587 [Dreissena polymorpha]|nr:hypothetical protein DPMN_159587 [Dreissena polymorpha]
MMHDLYVHRANRLSMKMTKMLVLCTAYFLLATAPISTYFVVESYLRPGYEESGNYLALAKRDLIWAACYLFGLSNYCVNFYLYTATNDRFYKEFKALIHCQPR